MCIMEIVVHVRPNKKKLDDMCIWKIASCAFYLDGSLNFLKLIFKLCLLLQQSLSLKTIPSAMTSF